MSLQLLAVTPDLVQATARPMGPAEAKAWTILYPSVTLAGATIEEVIEYIRMRRGCDPSPGFDGQVNIILLDEAPTSKIFLDLKDISMREALRYSAELAGLTVTYRDHAAIVHKPGHRPYIAPVDSPLMRRANAIVLPKVQMNGATVAEAVEDLRRQSVAADPTHQGINIVLKPGTEKAPPVSLDLRRIPLAEAVCYVALLANVRLEAGENTLVISPK